MNAASLNSGSGVQPDRRGSFGNLHSGSAPSAAIQGGGERPNVGPPISSEHRNFPQHSQATLPHQYQQFGPYVPSSSGLNHLNVFPPPNHQRPSSEQTFPPFNIPHLRSSPHGYAESIATSSPITPYKHDYAFQTNAYHTDPANANATISSPLNAGSYHRRRESMPDMMGNGAFHQYTAARPSIPAEPSSAGSEHYPYVHPAGPGGMSSPLQASVEPYRSLQPMTATAYPNHQMTTPTSSGRRSRGSTFGSRTTDEDVHPNSGIMGMNNSTDEGDGSRPATGDNTASVTVKDFESEEKKKQEQRSGTVDADVDDETSFGMDADVDEKLDHRKRKRNRTIRSCVPCHNHKRKCDRKRPCGRCTALGLTGTCVYEIDEARDMNDPDVAETDRLRRRIAELEQVVRELRQKAPTKGQTPSASTTIAVVPPIPEEGVDDAKKRRVIIDRFARFKLDEAKDAENSAATGHINPNFPVWAPHSIVPTRSPSSTRSLEVSDQMSHRPTQKKDYKQEPYEPYLLPGEEMSADKTGRKIFLGVLSGKSMLRRLRELAETKGDGELLTVPEDVAFTGVFPDMRKTYPFTTIWSHENFNAEIVGLLPTAEQAELLWDSWEEYGTYFHPVHMPSLRAEYKKFFAMSTDDKRNTPLSSLALFLIVCAIGCVLRATCSELFGHPDLNVVRQHLNPAGSKFPMKDPKDLTCSRLQSELYLSASFHALRLCAFLANPTIRTIQCQFLLNVYLLTSERAADAWSHGGTLIKQAIAIGLHKDPLSMDANISMLDAEVRRRLWWSIAGFDCMLCMFFGRPSQISYYTTNLPQDRPDDELSDAPGSAQRLLPPSNVLVNETTEQTFHAAYYQLIIPSLDILDRIFQMDKRATRSMIYGWLSRLPKDQPSDAEPEQANQHTYQDALRLAQNITQWYAHLPAGIQFRVEDSAQFLLSSRNRRQMNQTLLLSIKTWTLVMVLHRPYLRFDATAYPESTEICLEAAHRILKTYKSMAETRCNLAWMIWTMPYRAFQAGAVCAFLAIRQPGTDLAAHCMDDLRGAISIFEDRLSNWNVTHPVQADLCEGLIRLEKLVTAATQQRTSPQHSTSVPQQQSQQSPINVSPNLFGFVPNNSPEGYSFSHAVSHMQGFPHWTNKNPLPGGDHPPPSHITGGDVNNGANPRKDPIYNTTTFQSLSDGISNGYSGDFNGPEPLALPGYWASMFGIKMENEKDGTSGGLMM